MILKMFAYLIIALTLALFCSGLVWGEDVANEGLTEEDIEALRERGRREGWTFTVDQNAAIFPGATVRYEGTR